MRIPNIFRYFNTSAEIIRLTMTTYARFPPPLRNVGNLLLEHGIGTSREVSFP